MTSNKSTLTSLLEKRRRLNKQSSDVAANQTANVSPTHQRYDKNNSDVGNGKYNDKTNAFERPQRRSHNGAEKVSGSRSQSSTSGSDDVEHERVDYEEIDGLGKEIGGYRIHNKLVGKGAFSTIFEASSVDDPEKVYAAKVSPKQKSVMTDMHYYNAVENLYSVNHPNIIRLYANSETNSHYYLFLDHFTWPTVTLSEYLMSQEQGFLDHHVALVIFVQIIAGIAHLHRQNIAHRDIKPDNILVNPETLLVTIIDFGFSTTEQSVVDSLGSPLYMSPEILNAKEHDPKAGDVWSAGIILYQMLFGVHPFRSKSVDSLRNAVVSDAFHIPKNYPIWGFKKAKEVDQIVHEILYQTIQKDVDKRILSEMLEKKFSEAPFLNLFKRKQSLYRTLVKTLEITF